MHTTTRNYLLGSVAAVALLTVAVFLQLAPPTADSQTAPAAVGGNKQIGSVASMVDDLAMRLRQEPDDAKGWLLLARSYQHLGRIEEAQKAYRQATLLGELDEDLAALNGAAATSATAARRIVGSVTLSSAAEDIVLPTDTVFIFARAVDGPEVPVAVVQRSAADLPLEFSLTDGQAMSAETRLSNFDSVVVTAKVSRMGDPSRELQALQARSNIVRIAENRRVKLIIE
ncbi:MAG: hypothetical protein WBN09_03365 [Woeseiaceae bacterium]